jgi:membrane-bound inhibitor of C-type lysozyme
MRALAPLLVLALSATACSRDAGPTPADAGDAAPSTPEAGSVSYRCDDGTMLKVDYGDADASIAWADGRSATLPRAESASAGGADAYVGNEVSLQRTASGIELHDGDEPARSCSEVPAEDGTQADAAGNAGVSMRYDCDAGTRVTVMSDGTADVALPEGRTVRVSRVAGSAPPVFAGDTLYFTIDEVGARLSQDGEARELACTAA